MKYSRIEFGIATMFFIIGFFSAFSSGYNDFGRHVTIEGDGLQQYIQATFPHVLIVIATYAGFLMLNFYVVPRYWFKKKYFDAIGSTLLVLIAVGSAFMAVYSYLRAGMYVKTNSFHANMDFFSRGFITATVFLFIYALYVLVRELIIYQYKLSRTRQSLQSRVIREVILVFSIWLAVLIPTLMLRGTGLMRDFGPFYFFVLPYCFILYFLNLYWLIPRYKQDRDASGIYFLRLAMTIAAFGIVELAFLLQVNNVPVGISFTCYWLLPSLIVPGISWSVYLANQETYQQLANLKTELGNTNANLQYLRSQINPHFLFNALNTLYGTALMEKAEKTGEGIQRLGDMMRFMLHENHLDKIALNRELEYLHNYIDLQNMRLALSPDILIDIQIDEMDGYYEIAPMLLIPFIENAYKHGISLQEKSWINAALYQQDDMLNLDVRNSIHPINQNDPELEQSGTGLANVRQRLELIYPGRHHLVVRQNAKEFFVHLSITLHHIKTL